MIGVGNWVCSELERELVNEVLDSGRLSYGPKSKELERRFSKLHGCSYGVLSNSGTSSLQVALQALKEIHGWPDGSKVVVPSVTFVATMNVVLHNRMTPVLVDVDPATYNMDPGELWEAIGKHDDIKCVMPVHLFGQPAAMEDIDDVLADRDIAIIEDSCECMFASVAGRPVGSWGEIGCFSFYVAHLLTTGVGGIATTNNADYAAKMRSLVNHGRDGIYISIDDDSDASGDELREIITRRFRFESVGHSFRITELEAALGLGQMDTWHRMIHQRRQNAGTLSLLLDPSRTAGHIQLPRKMKGADHSYMMYPIVLLNEDKAGLCAYLEENGIETREMLPLTNQPVYNGMFNPSDYPVATWINKSGFYIGCHQYLTEAELEYMAEKINGYLLRGER